MYRKLDASIASTNGPIWLGEKCFRDHPFYSISFNYLRIRDIAAIRQISIFHLGLTIYKTIETKQLKHSRRVVIHQPLLTISFQLEPQY